MKRTVLYVISINWDFIKQRPQFIAESLAEYYEILVVERLGFKDLLKFKRFKKREVAPGVIVKGIFLPTMEKLQQYDRVGFVDFISGLFAVLFLNPNRYNYLYIGNCISYRPFRFILKKKVKLIYDCMDDEREFPNAINNRAKYYSKIEKEIIKKADFVFCTSDYLKTKLLSRCSICRNISIVRNAIALPTQHYGDELPYEFRFIEKLCNTILYIGAIAPWFDFDTILYCLKENNNVNIVLVGPVHDIEIPQHPRLFYLGSCEHKYIYTLMSKSDILVMPFVVNELIRSVNPVKLYEYIYSGKPVVASRYDETERFDEYIYLYSDAKEFTSIVVELMTSNFKSKQSELMAKIFASSNTWDNRVKELVAIIETVKN